MVFCPYMWTFEIAGALVDEVRLDWQSSSLLKEAGKLHQRVETTWMIRKLVPLMVLVGVAGKVSDAVSMQSYSVGKGLRHETLVDLVHSRFDDYDHTNEESVLYAAPDLFLVVVTFPLLTMILARVYLKNELAFVLLCRKVLYLFSLLTLMRASCVAVTIIPSPIGSCKRAHGNETYPPQNGTLISSIYCHDQMFSGHSMTNVLVWMMVVLSDLPNPLKALATILIGVALFVTIITRDHYTVDVLVAVYITISLCLVYREPLYHFLHGKVEGDAIVPISSIDAKHPPWRLILEKECVETIHTKERKFFGRSSHIPDRTISRKHLILEGTENHLVGTCLGKRSIYLMTSASKREIHPNESFTCVAGNELHIPLSHDEQEYYRVIVKQ